MNATTLELMVIDAFDKLRQIYAMRPLIQGGLATAQDLFIENKDVIAADLAAKGYTVGKTSPPIKSL